MRQLTARVSEQIDLRHAGGHFLLNALDVLRIVAGRRIQQIDGSMRTRPQMIVKLLRISSFVHIDGHRRRRLTFCRIVVTRHPLGQATSR